MISSRLGFLDLRGPPYQSLCHSSKFPMMAMLKRIFTVRRKSVSSSPLPRTAAVFLLFPPVSLVRPFLPTRFALQLPIARSGFFPSNCAQAESRSLGHRYRTEDTPQARLNKMAAVFLKATLLFTTLKVRGPLCRCTAFLYQLNPC